MSTIEFEEEEEIFHIKSRAILGEPKTPAMITTLLKTGVVKNEKQALFVLLGAILITVTTTIFIITGSVGVKEAYVYDDNGNKYELEEYIKLRSTGYDPLEK